MFNFTSLINRICEPSFQLCQDPIQRKLRCRRNKGTLSMILILTSFFLLYLFLQKPPVNKGQYCFTIALLLTLVTFCFSCRSSPWVFQVVYTLITAISGPLSCYVSDEGVFSSWVGVSIYPNLVSFFFESSIPGIVQMVLQLVYAQTIYKHYMIDALNATTSQTFIQRIANMNSFSVMINIIVIALIGYYLENTYAQDLIISEHKRKQYEKQKAFFLSFSPELRNLINTLAGNIQLSLLENIPLQVRNFLENAEIGANLLLQMINNIQDSGKVEVGELEINHSPVAINSALEKMWSVCSYLIKAKGLNGKLKISNKIPKVLRLDHYRLMQILLNLIGNAVKFTRKGYVNITVEWISNSSHVEELHFKPYPYDEEEEGLFEKQQAMSCLDRTLTTVNLSWKKWDQDRKHRNMEESCGVLKISVSDTGCGISPETFDTIFERLESHNTQKRMDEKQKGAHLGLYITKELCKKMEGEIRAFTKQDVGATFIVCLPVVPILIKEEAFKMSLEHFLVMATEQKLKAMVVDDLDFNVIILQKYFCKMSINVEKVAKDGLEAYESYVKSAKENSRFEIVTMDVEMPVMDGKEAARKIREYERENNLKPCLLIMVSGNCSESEINQCLAKDGNVNADYFLKKPATFDEVFDTLAKHFSG